MTSTFTDLFGQQTVPPAASGYSGVVLSANSTLAWENDFSGVVANQFLASTFIDVSCATVGLDLKLPAADVVSAGAEIYLRNIGTNTLNVQDYDGNNLTDVSPGQVKYFIVTDNTTEAGEWGIFTFGAGMSGADASELAGNGLKVISNTLNVDAPYRGVNTDYTLQAIDRGNLVDVVSSGTAFLPSSSAYTANLPSLA